MRFKFNKKDFDQKLVKIKMPGQDYRSWNAKAPRATPAARLRLMPPRKPHRGFRAGVVATPKRKHAKYSEGFLITLVAARFGSLDPSNEPR